MGEQSMGDDLLFFVWFFFLNFPKENFKTWAFTLKRNKKQDRATAIGQVSLLYDTAIILYDTTLYMKFILMSKHWKSKLTDVAFSVPLI